MLKFRWETEFKETKFVEIPKDWNIRRLEEIATVESGGRAPQAERYFVKGKHSFVRVKHLNDDKYLRDFDLITEEAVKDYNLKLYKERVIVFPRSGESINLGKYNIIPFNSYIVNHLAIVQGQKNICNSDFLFYVLVALNKFTEEEIAGTTLPYLRTTDIGQRKILYPRPVEQVRIATVLSWFDKLIENKKRQIEVYKAAAEAIFKNMFFNFSSLRKSEYDPSLIKDLPDGWEVKPIGKIAKCVSGFSYSSKEKFEEKVDDSYVFINLNNLVEGGGFKPEYSWLKSDKLKDRHYLEECDLIISNVHFGVGGSETERLMAVPALVSFPPGYDKKLGVYSMDLTRIIPNSPKMKYYMYEYLKITREDSASFSTGTSILHLDHKNFRKNKMIICPDDPALEQFNSQVGPMFKKIMLNQKQIIILKNVRDTLLPLLVFGKLRVEEI